MGDAPGDEYDLARAPSWAAATAADIQLEDPFASSRHAQISRQGDVLVIEDLDSTNGTYLNGDLLEGRSRCMRATAIRIGDNEFCFVQ